MGAAGWELAGIRLAGAGRWEGAGVERRTEAIETEEGWRLRRPGRAAAAWRAGKGGIRGSWRGRRYREMRAACLSRQGAEYGVVRRKSCLLCF